MNVRSSRLPAVCGIWIRRVLALGAVLWPLAVNAQTPPAIQGTIALEGTTKKVYSAANTIAVATADGVEHIYHFTRQLVVHGGKGNGVDALQGLGEGATVVVHYTVEGGQRYAQEIDRVGDGGLKTTEAIVEHIDRHRKQITIKLASGATETLQLTDRAAASVGKDVDAAGAPRIVIYYSDEGGRKVAHYFKRVA